MGKGRNGQKTICQGLDSLALHASIEFALSDVKTKRQSKMSAA